jgi:hypothetical protein
MHFRGHFAVNTQKFAMIAKIKMQVKSYKLNMYGIPV